MIRRLAIGIAIAAASAAAIVATGATEAPKGTSYKVVFDNAFGLTEGGDLRVGGVRAGQTTSFGLTDTEPTRAVVGFEITEPGFESLRSDATCAVRQQSLIGEYFVDCQPGSDEEELEPGATIPVEQTESVIPVDLVQDVLRLPYRERFSLILAELGTGLAGRPDDLAAALERAHPGLRETSKTLRILGDQRRVLEDFASNASAVVSELARNRTNVGRFVREAGEAAEVSASERTQLEAGFERLPGFLEQLGPYMTSLERVADEQIALLPDVRRSSGDLKRFFDELGPFSEGARPALRALANASDKGVDALDASRDAVHQLAQASKDAPGAAKPLRQFLISLDDRKRAVDPDPRARRSAPPAPDPTHRHLRRGFTGFEGFLNYAYWQTLAINGFDEISHFLRIYGVIDQCSPYNVDPPREMIERCNAYFGPFQPGIENATGEINGHDFGRAESGNYSDYGGRKVNRQNRGSKEATGKGRARSSSAEPVTAGRDDERPVETSSAPSDGGGQQLVPDVQRLVDDLTGGLAADQPPADDPPAQPDAAPEDGTTRLLDFLLGP